MNLPPNELNPSLYDANDYDYDPRESDSDEPIGLIDQDPIELNGTSIFENSRSDTMTNAEVLLLKGGFNH